MNLIYNNPYRIVGLLIGASAKEQQRQIKRLIQYIEAEQDPKDDFSFPTLGNLQRSIDSVNDAASKLNLDSDKMNAALFWFYNGNSITDEPAFDAIKEGDLDQVINIWTKLTTSSYVTHRNASAYSNLSTLYLSGILEGTYTDEAIIEQGISLKLKFLESDFIKDFKALATDETFKITKKEIQLLFLNQLQSEIGNNGATNSITLINVVTKQEFLAKEDFLKGFVQKPIDFIERKIEEVKKKRQLNKDKAGERGEQLYNDTKESFSQLKAMLDSTDIKLYSIADKLANEILQCSIILFNHFYESDTEVGETALELNKKAKSIAIGSVAKARINESFSIIEKYVQQRPKRSRQNVVRNELNFITTKLENFQQLKASILNAQELSNSCKPQLDNIKLKIGQNDEVYITISTAVLRNAQAMIVSTVNDALEKRNAYVEDQNKVDNPFIYTSFPQFRNLGNSDTLIPKVPYYSLDSLKSIISSAWSATIILSKFDILQSEKVHFEKNKASLKSIAEQLNIPTNFGQKINKATGNCYIATMVYGDYDHPQVIILRQFRDNVLAKSSMGKCFISTYYHFSPKLAEKLKNKKIINITIRNILNQFIKLVK